MNQNTVVLPAVVPGMSTLSMTVLMMIAKIRSTGVVLISIEAVPLIFP